MRRYSSADPAPTPDLAKLEHRAGVGSRRPSTLSTDARACTASSGRCAIARPRRRPRDRRPRQRRRRLGAAGPLHRRARGRRRAPHPAADRRARSAHRHEARGLRPAVRARPPHRGSGAARHGARRRRAAQAARRAPQGSSPGDRRRVDALRQRAEQITGLRSTGGPSAQDDHSLSAIGDDLDKLDGAVDGADAAPSPDAVAGFEKIQPKLAAALAAWQAFKAKQSVSR